MFLSYKTQKMFDAFRKINWFDQFTVGTANNIEVDSTKISSFN